MQHTIKGEQAKSLVDQWHRLHSQPAGAGAALPITGIDGFWEVFLSAFVQVMLSLPHENADCERGFSENKRIVDSGVNLSIVRYSQWHSTCEELYGAF